jgi:hypothetical protein
VASQPLPRRACGPLPLPWLPQTDFDHLLAAADLALVRGEDSVVRAQLVGRGPVLWQIYPQSDGAHAPKLDAWMDRLLAGSPRRWPQPCAGCNACSTVWTAPT